MRPGIVAAVTVAALACGCTPRPWNFDETDRIGAVMGQGWEDPLAEATLRATAAPELPDVLPYPQPVYVRPSDEKRPSLRGKRASTAERAGNVIRTARASAAARSKAR